MRSRVASRCFQYILAVNIKINRLRNLPDVISGKDRGVPQNGVGMGSSLPGKQFADEVGHDAVSAEPAWVCALVAFWTMVCNLV